MYSGDRMYFARTSRDLTASEMVIHRLCEITSRHDVGLDRQVEALLRLGLDRFDLDIGMVSRVFDSTYEVVNAVVPDGTALSRGDRFDLEETYCSITVSADGPVGFESAGESSFASHPAYGVLELEAYIGIPIHVGGALYGTLSFAGAQARDRSFDAVDVDCLRLMGSWLSTELLRRGMEAELERARKNLEVLVRVDPLTELANRRGVGEMLEGVSRRSAHGGSSLSCLLIDIDDFKGMNDRFGEAVGDQVIRSVAELIRTCLRPGDLAGRVGGDEFVAILPGADAEEAQAVAWRVTEKVRTLEFDMDGDTVRVTVSVGVTELPKEVTSVTDVLEKARDLLRVSRRVGANRVTAALVRADPWAE